MYKIQYLNLVAEDVKRFSVKTKSILEKAINTRLAVNPVTFGKALNYSLKGYRRLRVGDYRIIYKIQDNTVIIVAIKHRKEVYCH